MDDRKETPVMASPTIATVVKMLEALPETTQNQVVEHLREYIAEVKVSYKKNKQERPIGILKGKATYKIKDDFKITDEELLNAR